MDSVYCLTSLKDQKPEVPSNVVNSMSKSNVAPSSERVAIYVIEFAASAGLSSSGPLTTLANPR